MLFTEEYEALLRAFHINVGKHKSIHILHLKKCNSTRVIVSNK